jgi:hypothetical protein
MGDRFTSPLDTFCDFEWKRAKNNVTMQGILHASFLLTRHAHVYFGAY